MPEKLPTRLGGKKLAELFSAYSDACMERDMAQSEVERLVREWQAVPAILEGLRQVYTPMGAGIWLYAANAHFQGENPAGMIVAGDAAAVLKLVEAMRAGSM